jgi:hypothetical protein
MSDVYQVVESSHCQKIDLLKYGPDNILLYHKKSYNISMF